MVVWPLMAVIFMWEKTDIVYFKEFHLEVGSPLQRFVFC